MDRNNLILQFSIRKGKRKILPYKRGGAEVARNLMLDRLQIRLHVGLMAFGR